MNVSSLCALFLALLLSPLAAQTKPDAVFQESFEAGLANWQSEGAVQVVSMETFKGLNALVLSKTESTLRDKVSVVGPIFPVTPGTLELQYATKTDLTSMDNSYNGSLELEFLTVIGGPLGTQELGSWFKQTPWKINRTRVEIPDDAIAARLIARINKETPGKFWLDEISARVLVGERKDDGLRQMMLKMGELGHLLHPETPREANIEVFSTKELPESLLHPTFTVTDYWGAEQFKPIPATLKANGKAGYLFKYVTKVSLSEVPLEIGRYYELHGEIPREGFEPFKNYTSFAILPEAEANQYKPEEIPFTSRTWDQRYAESPKLTRRLGIRFCNVWGRMTPKLANLEAPQIELVHELGMGVLTSSPAQGIEARAANWQKLLANDGELLRKGVRNYFEKWGNIRPTVVNLGNEPHSKGAEVKNDVDAYRIVYTEIKKIDPSIYVVGTSVGASEEYFQNGFGEWCDAYDFHSYEDPEGVRDVIEDKYPAMFKKYGFAKPIWSTELGMNSQGMSRIAVASILYKKFINFFAGGGANASWFGLFYPDPDAKMHESFASAHNVFDCRYSQYAPKLDAIAYYNTVNSIAIKKYVTDIVYGTDTKAFLFRDRDGRALLVGYKNKGREDVFFPLPGVGAVEMIRIDGSRDTLDAGGKGINLTINEDPVLLLFSEGPNVLPEKLEPSAVQMETDSAPIGRSSESVLTAVLHGVDINQVDLKAPPFWGVKKSASTNSAGQNVASFSLEVPAESLVRDANFTIEVKGAGKVPAGLLTLRLPVAGMLSADILPVPATSPKGPGVQLFLTNNSPQKQSLTWNLSLDGEQSLKSGAFQGLAGTDVSFAESGSGALELEPMESKQVEVPLSGVKPLTVYHIKGTVRNASGRVISLSRQMAGFIGVRKASGALVLDGRLDEESWQKASVETLEQADDFYAFKIKEKSTQTWTGPEDLSAQIRYVWDEQFLYVGVGVKDDVAGPIKFEGSSLWKQDGLQFLIDPSRASSEKPGKYEYSIGEGTKGVQTWCTLSADAGAPPGEAKEIQVAIQRANGGDLTYEIAIPWARLAPFKPSAGANLGFTLILNEDDGNGRDSFMTWFGNAHTKDIDTVGDLILEK